VDGNGAHNGGPEYLGTLTTTHSQVPSTPIKSTTVPQAPFTKPYFVHKFWVSMTLAPTPIDKRDSRPPALFLEALAAPGHELMLLYDIK
jgi:hypothetical protein